MRHSLKWGLIFLFVCNATAFAQSGAIQTLQLLSKPVLLENEIIADRDENRDINGNLTAGIHILTNLAGLTFQSQNGIVKTQKNEGGTLLYVSTNEQRVNIFLEGYPPFELVLSDLGIDLEEGEIWQLEVGAVKRQEVDYQTVTFEVDPEDATLFINDTEYQIDGDMIDVELPAAAHFVQVFSARHEVIEDSILVSADAENYFAYSLTEATPQSVTISSRPAGASVYLNGEMASRGVTPLTVNLYPGTIEITLRLEGYKSVSDKFLFSGQEEELDYNLKVIDE